MQLRFKNLIYGLLMLIFPLITQGQPAEIDTFRIKRDIRIMESILDKLLDDNSTQIRMPGDTKGFYIPDYGMIFYLKKTQPYQHFMLKALEDNLNQVRLMQTKSGNHVKSPSNANYDQIMENTEKIESESMDKIKSGITEFLSNYASSSSFLKDRDRITVLVNLDGWRSLSNQNKFLSAWVEQKHAESLRKSRNADETLKSKIHFDLESNENPISQDIDIMSEILDQAMATGPKPRYASTSGLYLAGLGALFFMEIQPVLWSENIDTSFSIVIHNTGDAVAGYSFTSQSRPAKDKSKSSPPYHALGLELFDLMISYGHTLHLKPEEKFIIEVNTGPQFSFIGLQNKEPSTIRLQLYKRDLDAYNQGNMKIDELKEKIVIQYL